MRVALCIPYALVASGVEPEEGFILEPDGARSLYASRHFSNYQRRFLLDRYLFGDGEAKGLLGGYLHQHDDVNLITPRTLDCRPQVLPEIADALDGNLVYLKLGNIFSALERNVAVVGYRCIAADKKFCAAQLMSAALPPNGTARVPRQRWLSLEASLEPGDVRAVEEALEADFLMCRGNWSSGSREGHFPHLVVARGALSLALAHYAPPRSGVVVSEFIHTSTWPNGIFHKVHVIQTNPGGLSAPVYQPLAAEHYQVRNQVDLAEVARRRFAPFEEVARCVDPGWLRFPASELAGLNELCTALPALDPLGSIVAMDAMNGTDGKLYFLEANHFAATYLDRQFTAEAPIDFLCRQVHFENTQPGRQLELLNRYGKRLKAVESPVEG